MTTPSCLLFHQNKKRQNPSPHLFLPSPQRPQRGPTAFTLVELLGVITIIGILAGLTLGGAGAVRRHGAISQAKTEIAALQAASERYYADNGAYPTNSSQDNVNCSPQANFDPSLAQYSKSSAVLFSNLLGSTNLNAAPSTNNKRYFEPKPNMVSGNFFIDPWGNSYGYYSDGTNAPLIWSTAGEKKGGPSTNKWVASWPKL